jgi:cytochrome P450
MTIVDRADVNELPQLNLGDPAFWQDVYPSVNAAREASPLARDQDGMLWLLRCDEAEAALKNPAFLVMDFMGALGLSEGPVWEWWQQLMTSKNPPEHTRLRRLVSRSFTPGAAERLRPMIRNVAEELLAEANGSGVVDVLAGHGIAHRLPSTVIAAMLGVPPSDVDFFIENTTAIGLAFGAATDLEIRAQVEAALDELDRYVRDLIANRRAQHDPGNDLLAELLGAEENGDRLSTDEIVWLVENLLFAGHDTTRGAIATTLALLSAHPDQIEQLRQGTATVDNAVEEVLRYEAITFATSRSAGRAVEVGGMRLDEGTPLMFCLPALSRDPRRWSDPDRFDVTRPDPKPPTFGAGVHYCLGAALARVELQEVLAAVLRNTASFTITEEPKWVPFAFIRRYERLLVDFRPA